MTKQINFSNAFVQAESGDREQLFVTLPSGVHHPLISYKEVALRLKKSLYRQKDAPRLCLKKVKKGKEDLGFAVSEADPCLFLYKGKGILLLLYVNDVMLFHREMAVLNQEISDLQKSFSLTKEDLGKEDTFAYLGTKLQFNGPKVTMTHNGLIKKIFKTSGYKELNGANTPVNERPQGANV